MIHEAVQMRDALSVLFAVPLIKPLDEAPPSDPPVFPLSVTDQAAPARLDGVKTAPRKVSAEKVYETLPDGFTVGKVMELTGMAEKAAYSAIYRLRAKGLVENMGAGLWHKLSEKS